MAGGLVQLAVYGSQDIFLTSNPQITFFKSIHRRHTNFAIETINQQFIGIPNFGQEMTSVIDKMGDLMHQIYLEISLPKIDLTKNQSLWEIDRSTAKKNMDHYNIYYQLIYDYLVANTHIIRKLNILTTASNIDKSDIIAVMNNKDFLEELSSTRAKLYNFMEEYKYNTNSISQSDIVILFNNLKKNNKLTNDEFRHALYQIIHGPLYGQLQEFYTKIYQSYLNANRVYKSIIDGTYVERYQFAWVEELGNAMIDYVDIKIGSERIDRQTGDWLIIYSKLFGKKSQQQNYDKMIGNINTLTSFNDDIKEPYKLYIPIPFWFCRYIGQSIPLVALRYHDVTITAKLKNLDKICYIQDSLQLGSMENIQSQYNINLVDAQLHVDYIFLDKDERNRFAQSSHEYLIETIQYEEFDNIVGSSFSAHPDFNHPTKYVVWFVQPTDYRENPTGSRKCQWNKFCAGISEDDFFIDSTYIKLNTYERTPKDLNVKYYNFVQPYLYFERSPDNGIYVYSFAIMPMLQQPSSTLNLSRIDDFNIMVYFSKKMMNLLEKSTDKTAFMGIYVVSYNILRFISGMAGVAFK